MNAAAKAKIGAKLGRDLTILGTIEADPREPVYIVWHHTAWCPMACKVLRHVRRAQREGDIMAALAHPNMVRFFGVEEPGLLLMEFLEGPTLRRLIDRQKQERLSISNAVRVAIHLGAALEHIHHKGFLHLDLKPSNVIVTHGRPVLYDFGIGTRAGRRTAAGRCRHRPLYRAGRVRTQEGHAGGRRFQPRRHAVRHAHRRPAVSGGNPEESLPAAFPTGDVAATPAAERPKGPRGPRPRLPRPRRRAPAAASGAAARPTRLHPQRSGDVADQLPARGRPQGGDLTKHYPSFARLRPRCGAE